MAKETPAQKRKVHKVMKEYKQGKLKSGGSGRKVKSRKQAVAIAMSEADVPPQKGSQRAKAAAKKKTTRRTPRKTTAKRNPSTAARKRAGAKGGRATARKRAHKKPGRKR